MAPKLALVLGMLVLFGGCTDSDDPAALNPADGVGTETTPGSTTADADLATVQDYELTMEGIDKYYETLRNVAVAMKDMSPAEREQFDMSVDAEEAGSLDDLAARFDENPILRQALADAGLSAREYAVLTMSIIQSGMAAAVIEMRPDADPDSLARAMQANPENIAFMREHEEELQAKQQAMAEEMERMGVTDEEEE